VSGEVQGPDGFLGMKWGESFDECKRRDLCVDHSASSGAVPGTDRVGNGKTQDVNSVRFNYVMWGFKDDKCVWGQGIFGSSADFPALERALTEKYGEPIESNDLRNANNQKIGVSHKWKTRNSIVELRFNRRANEGELFYVSSEFRKKQLMEEQANRKRIKDGL
jgi:hypothetical protein